MKRKKSSKLVAAELEYHKVRADVLMRARGRCQLQIPGVCTGRAEHTHHRQRRKADNHTHANLAAICDRCHDYAHGHPTEAYEMGWLVRSTDDPAKVPVRRK